MKKSNEVNLSHPLTLRNSFLFPVQSALSRKEVIIGGLWLLVPVIGWILNMGHRICMVHNMQHGKSAWPAWNNYGGLFRHGLLTFLGMIEYHLPSVILEYFAWHYNSTVLHILSAILWIVATIAVPGFMSHYCYAFDAREIFDPMRAMRRVLEGGREYWKAWLIALCALLLSFSGLLLFGIGFLFTSVWFWQTAGFSFACVFTKRFELREEK